MKGGRRTSGFFIHIGAYSFQNLRNIVCEEFLFLGDFQQRDVIHVMYDNEVGNRVLLLAVNAFIYDDIHTHFE